MKSVTDLILKLNSPSEIVEINDFESKEPLEINSDNFKCLGIIFSRCKLGAVTFKNIDVESHLSFFQCEFSSLGFNSVRIESLAYPDVYYSYRLNVFDCKIDKYLLIGEGCEIHGAIGILNSNLNDLKVHKISSMTKDFFIRSTEIKYIQMFDNVFGGIIQFDRCKEIGRIIWHSIKSKQAIFENSKFTGVVDMGNYQGSAFIDDCTFDSGFEIKADVIDGIAIRRSIFNKYANLDFEFINNRPLKINISTSAFNEGFLINGSTSSGNNYLEELVINFSNKFAGFVRISNFLIGDFILKGVNVGASLILHDISPKRVSIVDFSNYSNIQFLHFQAYVAYHEADFSIQNSYLGKTQFIDVDFDTFNKINVNNSFLAEIITSNVNWFNPSKLNAGSLFKGDFGLDKGSDGYNGVKYYQVSVIREIYKQLKLAMEKHSNRTDALMFQQLEMKYYELQLKYSNKQNMLDQIILCTNNSNDHGQNWLKPILLAIPFTALFYFLIVIVTSDKLSSVPSGNTQHIIMTLQELWGRGRLFFVLFNPVRNLEKTLGEGHITGFIEFLDLLHRILISYFIFQTVSAFRKYTKN